MKTIRSFILVSVLTGSLWAVESWPQFRGPGGLATAPEGARIPLVWGDKENLKWKMQCPARVPPVGLHRKASLSLATRATGRAGKRWVLLVIWGVCWSAWIEAMAESSEEID